jgi:ABC-type phosphate transport system permease subunit
VLIPIARSNCTQRPRSGERRFQWSFTVSLFSAGVVLAVMIIPFITDFAGSGQRRSRAGVGATLGDYQEPPCPAKRVPRDPSSGVGPLAGRTMANDGVGNELKIKRRFSPGYSIAAVSPRVHGSIIVHQRSDRIGLVLFALTIVINGMAACRS